MTSFTTPWIRDRRRDGELVHNRLGRYLPVSRKTGREGISMVSRKVIDRGWEGEGPSPNFFSEGENGKRQPKDLGRVCDIYQGRNLSQTHTVVKGRPRSYVRSRLNLVPTKSYDVRTFISSTRGRYRVKRWKPTLHSTRCVRSLGGGVRSLN